MNWFLLCMRKYADFSGRARRKEYWMFTLIVAIGTLLLGALGQVSMLFGFLYFLAMLAVLVPGLSAGVRRLHDTGRSGWMLLLAFIPLLGLIVIYWLALDSQPGSNPYGPNPKEDVLEAAAA